MKGPKDQATQQLAERLIAISSARQVQLTLTAAETLADKFLRGDLTDQQLDALYEDWARNSVSTVDDDALLNALKGPHKSAYRVEILDFLEAIPQRIHEQKRAISLSPNHLPRLIPEAEDYCEGLSLRMEFAIQRIRACPRMLWWSELDRASYMSSNRQATVVKPVECCVGESGSQCIVGFLINKNAGKSQIPQWCIQDSSQSLDLDVSQIAGINGLFLHENIVLLHGTLTKDLTFVVADIEHPPSDLLDSLYKGERFKRISGQIETPLHPEEGWLIFGNCHLDVTLVLSNIYGVLQQERRFRGVIFIGDFLSHIPLRTFIQRYVQAFQDLEDKLRLCEDLLTNKDVILIPGMSDVGPKFLPKLPLIPSLLAPLQSTLTKFGARLTLTSNPVLVEIETAATSTRWAVVQSPLLYATNTLNLGLEIPFKKPFYPTSDELASHIPPLLLGQAHLAPLPFRAGSHLFIGRSFDYCLHLSHHLPDTIILSEKVKAFTTMWHDSVQIGCPGEIEHGYYCYHDLRRLHTRRLQDT